LLSPTLPFVQSLPLHASDYTPMPASIRNELLAESGMTPIRQSIMFAGRADPMKGFSLLLAACELIDQEFELLAILVGNTYDDANIKSYSAYLDSARFPHRVRMNFNRPLVRALCSSSLVTALAYPSRGEPIGTLPQEVALWAEESGPVVVAANAGGLRDQIDDRSNGVLHQPGNATDLARALSWVLGLDPDESSALRSRAAARVRRERDYLSALRGLWSHALLLRALGPNLHRQSNEGSPGR